MGPWPGGGQGRRSHRTWPCRDNLSDGICFISSSAAASRCRFKVFGNTLFVITSCRMGGGTARGVPGGKRGLRVVAATLSISFALRFCFLFAQLPLDVFIYFISIHTRVCVCVSEREYVYVCVCVCALPFFVKIMMVARGKWKLP